MMELNIPFKIFSGCKVVTGFRRSIIYDLNRYEYHFIPNDLAEILLNLEGNTITEISALYDLSERDIIDSYFNFLIENELIFFIPKKSFTSFPEIENDWFYPGLISNTVIEDDGRHNWNVILRNLSDVQCRNIQIRFSTTENFVKFVDFFKKLDDNNLTSIEIFLPYTSDINKENIDIYFKDFPLITRYYVYNAPHSELYYSGSSISIAIYTNRILEDIKLPAKVTLESFSPEVYQFIEAQSHNLYYNKKTCIDKNGAIKAGLNTTITFGTIYSGASLRYIYENVKEAKQFWDISRHKIIKCKDCEFRYMCVFDGEPIYDKRKRTYILNSNCGYDPTTAEFSTL